MTSFVVLLLLAQAGAQPTDSAVGPPRPAITIHEADAPGVRVFFLNIPWGPETFAAMERAGEGYYNRRSWPFARMETAKPLRIGETALPADNYALVFHPNTPKDEGMSFEVRKIAPGEFLQAGNVMTPTPEGETLWRAPVAFDTTETTVPALEIEVLLGPSAVRLHIRYGNRATQAVFNR
ncbi:MAG: hypothetical protein PVJ73_04380 [Acidobacteriota bacterium]|jgi:hypothetical protein|nr:hypothetical protein [Acidobacteriota bacterium]